MMPATVSSTSSPIRLSRRDPQQEHLRSQIRNLLRINAGDLETLRRKPRFHKGGGDDPHDLVSFAKGLRSQFAVDQNAVAPDGHHDRAETLQEIHTAERLTDEWRTRWHHGADESDLAPVPGQIIGIKITDIHSLNSKELLHLREFSFDEKKVVALQDRVRPGCELGLAAADDAHDMDVQGAAQPGFAKRNTHQRRLAGHSNAEQGFTQLVDARQIFGSRVAGGGQAPGQKPPTDGDHIEDSGPEQNHAHGREIKQ